MQNIKGAIFDMDGTLLDSMPVWKRLTQNYLKQFDLHITDQDFAACEGFSQPQVADYFLARHPELPLTREQMLDGMDELITSAGIAPRLVVTRSEEVHRLCTALGVPVLLHALPHRSDTVRLGLSALLRGQPALCGCLFVPGDQPLLRRSTVDGMCAAFAPSRHTPLGRAAL